MNLINIFTGLSMLWSVSVRTAKVQPNPSDYEYAFALHNPKICYISMENERENGVLYIDTEAWVEYYRGNFYTKERFVEKASKGIKYNQWTAGIKYKYFILGYALRHTGKKLIPSHNLTVGLNFVDNQMNLFGVNWKLISKVEFVTGFKDINLSSHNEVGFDFLTNLGISAIHKFELVEDKKFIQYKLMVSFKMPRFKKKGE